MLDSTAVSCSGLNGTGLSCYGLHCSALYLNGLDSTAVGLYGPGLCWIEKYWAGREWIGIGLDGRRFHWMDWTGLSRTGVRKTELDGSAFHWTGLSYSEAWLHQTALHCTILDLTGKYHTGQSLHLARLICTEPQSTFPNETDKDCTALYMNVLHWIRPHRIP